MLDEAAEWLLGWADSPHAVVALGLFTAAEAVFLPVPPEPLLIVLGLARPEHAVAFAGVCTAASVGGGMAGYALGRKGGRRLLARLFGEEKLVPVHRLLKRYGGWAVLIAALSPIPYKFATLSAGALGVNFRQFMIASLVGRSARYLPIGILIALFGEAFQPYLREYLGALAAVALLLLVIGLLASMLVGPRLWQAIER